MTAAGRSGHRPAVSIGSVLGQLRADFPDVTISKIRFLESEGWFSRSAPLPGTGSSLPRTCNGCATCSPFSAITISRSG